MRRILALLKKDIRRSLRRPLAPLAQLAFPILFAGMLALAFGGGGGGAGIPRARLLVADLDGALGASVIMQALASEQLASLIVVESVDEPTGRERLEQGDASALLVIPEGFTDDLLNTRETHLTFVRNPEERILPEIAEQALRVLTEVLQSASRVLEEPLREISADRDEAPSEAEVILIALSARKTIMAAEDLIFPPVIGFEEEAVEKDDTAESEPSNTKSTIFGMLLPGLAVYSMFMLGDLGMRDLLVEQREGTLRRQLSAPITTRGVLFGKGLYVAGMVSISGVILMVLSRFALGLPIDPIAFFVSCLSVAMLVVGITSAIYGLCRSERQASTIGSAVFLFLGFLGGSFMPIDNLPSSLQGFVQYNPFYWGTEGFRQVLLSGAGLEDIASFLLRLLVLGLLSAILGATLLQRKILSGVS